MVAVGVVLWHGRGGRAEPRRVMAALAPVRGVPRGDAQVQGGSSVSRLAGRRRTGGALSGVALDSGCGVRPRTELVTAAPGARPWPST